ncbi:MAG: hypothetical protein IJB96_10165 [Lachnospira sp.]|nr:hypothetical protein [Lachnospira sp.]
MVNNINYNYDEDNYDEECERVHSKREEYLASKNEDFEISFSGFFFVKDGVVPMPYEQCITIDEKGRVMLGVWDDSLRGRSTDSRGSFYDGIGGHYTLDSIVAWKPVNGTNVVARKIEK